MSLGTEQAVGRVDPDARADAATVHAFLNCYLRETGNYAIAETAVASVEPGPDGLLRVPLAAQSVDILAPLENRSPTGRHLFETPVRYRLADGSVHPADAATLAALVV
jgi:siderophore synthetase component